MRQLQLSKDRCWLTCFPLLEDKDSKGSLTGEVEVSTRPDEKGRFVFRLEYLDESNEGIFSFWARSDGVLLAAAFVPYGDTVKGKNYVYEITPDEATLGPVLQQAITSVDQYKAALDLVKFISFPEDKTAPLLANPQRDKLAEQLIGLLSLAEDQNPGTIQALYAYRLEAEKLLGQYFRRTF